MAAARPARQRLWNSSDRCHKQKRSLVDLTGRDVEGEEWMVRQDVGVRIRQVWSGGMSLLSQVLPGRDFVILAHDNRTGQA